MDASSRAPRPTGRGANLPPVPAPPAVRHPHADAGSDPAGDGADSVDARMAAAMEFLQRDFRRRPSLKEIARSAHLSPYHFHRSFRRCFGKTPKQCLEELQMAEVQRLILGGMSLLEAARQVGFTQQSHLTARFKKSIGVTPKAWLLIARAKGAGQTYDA